MARMPNADKAIVPREKIVNYLLAVDHPDGGDKAKVFLSFGFTVERWYDLRAALLRHARERECTNEVETSFGRKYIVEGPLHSPDGRTLRTRSVWIIPHDEQVPRLVTAYPE